jgi:hypothetical protein
MDVFSQVDHLCLPSVILASSVMLSLRGTQIDQGPEMARTRADHLRRSCGLVVVQFQKCLLLGGRQ